MKKSLLCSLVFIFGMIFAPVVQAGDCRTRDKVDWHATIVTATNVRIDCDDHLGPVGSSVGVVPTGEVVRILEVDRYQENYIVETSVGTGFVFRSFLKDIVESPLPRPETSIFIDLDVNHPYYSAILDVKARGIVSGGADGMIRADENINRAELGKILVEATTDDAIIAGALLEDGVYSDIDLNAWYAPYLKLARLKGIMTGDARSGSGSTTIRPADPANGAEVAKMIAVAFGLEVRQVATNEAWYVAYLEALKAIGALPYENGTHPVTRAEMMFMISVILNR